VRTVRCGCVLLAGLLALMPGCLEVDIHVKLNEDGSATVTEKLGFSEALLDLAAGSPRDAAILEKALSREGAVERLATMGTGVQLVSHEVGQRMRAGALYKEATAVYQIPDINNLRLSPPFPNLWTDGNICMTFLLEPCYERRPPNSIGGGIDLPGYMAVEYRFAASQPDGAARSVRRESLPPLSPVQAQKIRDLLPAFADLAGSASIKVTLETYNTLCLGWFHLSGARRAMDRDLASFVPWIELLNISGQNRDAYDRPLLADEETVIEFVRGDWAGGRIKKLLVAPIEYHPFRFEYDSKIPLVYADVTANRGRRFIFLPSKFHYKRYFEGKTFDDGFAPEPPK
jgi:hypothetical protein